MQNENAVNELRKNFISRYANENYQKYQAIRERVRDCSKGSATMKGIGAQSQNGGGNDFTSVMKYLLPTDRQRNNPREYLRYLMMADFPGYTESTLLAAMGLLGTGQDTVMGFENKSDTLKKFADGDRLMRVRLALNKAQLVDGGCVVFLEPAREQEIRSGGSAFRINIYPYDKYICSQLDETAGPQFILMDESDKVFNYELKQRVYENRYRVFGIDNRGNYYQAAIRAEDWAGFDVGNPGEWDSNADERDPQWGRANYPMFGKPLNYIPVDFCNVTSHEADRYDNPLLSVIADKDITIFNCDAAYRQTLWLTSQPIDVIYGDGKSRRLPYGAGSVHNLPKEFKEEWLEFSGAGANAQKAALEEMHVRAQEKQVSLLSDGKTNLSGAALQIIQGSQVAPLVNVVNTSGETMTKMLRYAVEWAGDRGTEEVKYVPSEVFSRMNIPTGELIQLLNLLREDRDGVLPLKVSELRRRLVESGIGDETLEDFDAFMDEVKQEREELGITGGEFA